MTATRLAVFDCDGTLVDSAHNIVAAMGMRMAANAGVAGIGVAWGCQPTVERTACGACAIAADFPALPALVHAAMRAR